MNHRVMISGISNPESDTLSIEHLPQAEELMSINWTKLGCIVSCLIGKLHGTGMDISAQAVLEAYRNLTGGKMLWLSALETCIYEDRFPADMRAEILIPESEAERLKGIFLCKALIAKLETGVVMALPVQQ